MKYEVILKDAKRYRPMEGVWYAWSIVYVYLVKDDGERIRLYVNSRKDAAEHPVLGTVYKDKTVPMSCKAIVWFKDGYRLISLSRDPFHGGWELEFEAPTVEVAMYGRIATLDTDIDPDWVKGFVPVEGQWRPTGGDSWLD